MARAGGFSLRSLYNHDAKSPIQCEEVLGFFCSGMLGIDYCEYCEIDDWKFPTSVDVCSEKIPLFVKLAYPLYYTVGSVSDTEMMGGERERERARDVAEEWRSG